MTNSQIELDELDRSILRFLLKDGRMPYSAMAEQLDVAEGTIRKRVGRLVGEGVIKIVGVLDPFKMGWNFVATVGFRIETDSAGPPVEALLKMPEVRQVSICAGAQDGIIEVAVRSHDELYAFLTEKLRRVPGIKGSSTSVVLRVCKESYTWDAGLLQNE